MPTILVTGGCGFIGSNFVRHVLRNRAGRDDRQLRRAHLRGQPRQPRRSGRPPALSLRPRRRDRSASRSRCRSGRASTAILHFAAESHVDRSIHRLRAVRARPTSLGTQVLLDAAREFKVAALSCKSQPMRSTAASGQTGAFTEDDAARPQQPLRRQQGRGRSAGAGYVHTFGLPAIITRCSNNYGPYQFPEKLIPLFITNLMRDQPVPVYGDGLKVRDWIHVRDHCAGGRRRLAKGQARRGVQLSAAAARRPTSS